MKNNLLKYVGAGLLFFISGYGAIASTVDELVAEYSVGFDTDGTGKAMAVPAFVRDVPASERAEVLAKILDRLMSTSPINVNAISGACRVLLDLDIPWTDHLKQSVYSLVGCPNWIVRACASSVLAKRRKDDARDVILSFQKDSDDRVRASMMDDIKNWPDAEPIYQKYIQAHEGDPNFAESVHAAKVCAILNRMILKKNSQ